MGQPFIFIFIAVVAVLILIFGARLVFNLTDTGDEIKEIVFYQDIEKKMNTISSDSYGSTISLESIIVPVDIKEICFVDYGYDYNVDNVNSEKLKLSIEGSYKIDDEKNIFVFGSDIEKIKSSKEIELDDFVLCDNLEDKKLNIKLINQGQKIKAESI